MFAGKMCLTDCGEENCALMVLILLMKTWQSRQLLRVDEGREGGQRSKENVLKSMRELDELLILL